MTRMKTYAGSALAALCLIGVAACGSSDDDGSEAASGTGSSTAASATRSGSVSQVDGRVMLEVNWNKEQKKIGFDNVSPCPCVRHMRGNGTVIEGGCGLPE